MKSIGVVLKAICAVTVFSSVVHAKDIDKSKTVKAPTSKAEFCAKADDPNYFKSLLYSEDNHLYNLNYGGIGGGGVCWWHSMFSRSATFLAVYRPELPRPSYQEALEIIEDIANNKGVVEIPGYRNLRDFSAAYGREIQSVLENMQIGDGIVGFGWIRGVSGSTEVSASKLKDMMDELYQEVKEKNRVVYQKLQIPGIESHAWLVVDMEKTDTGYVLDVLDSNYGSIYSVEYTLGMKKFAQYNMVPYTSRNGMDYSAFASAKKQYCSRGVTAKSLRERSRQSQESN